MRFISINDNVDSYLNPETITSLEVSFKNLMNENYSKDTLKKIFNMALKGKSRQEMVNELNKLHVLTPLVNIWKRSLTMILLLLVINGI